MQSPAQRAKKFVRRVLNKIGPMGRKIEARLSHSDEVLNLPARRELVRNAYPVLLGRPAENDEVIEGKAQTCPTRRSVVASFLGSEEFRQTSLVKVPAMSGFEPHIPVEVVSEDSPAFARLYDEVRTHWEELGNTDLHWSVMTNEQFRSDRFEEHRDAFYASGEHDAARLLASLTRAGVDPKELHTAIEHGCGAGRVTQWLAPLFEELTAVDISKPHLEAAMEHLTRVGQSHVKFALVPNLEAFRALPEVDAVYSVIVLQHNPPPVMKALLRALLGRLRPGGIAYFQVATYIPGYCFDAEKYLATKDRPVMEMHALPQRDIFDAVSRAGCKVLEVLEDSATGIGGPDVSNMFLIRRDR